MGCAIIFGACGGLSFRASCTHRKTGFPRPPGGLAGTADKARAAQPMFAWISTGAGNQKTVFFVMAAMSPETPLTEVVARVKPRLRGIPDVFATCVAAPAALWLIHEARGGTHLIAASVYGACLVLLFAVSATYHTFMWSASMRMLLRRFDHSMVYVLIAGSYTPVCLTVVEAPLGEAFLAGIWGIAALGCLKSFVWIHAPRTLNTAIYLMMGWLIMPLAPTIYRGVGTLGVALLAIGGLAYTVGALIYARRWPNPFPNTFGYHEVFHVLVVVAAACHYVTMWTLLT